ncbi:hypothetical protein BH20VER3_BH20VER3_02640 [soil metagenome]
MFVSPVFSARLQGAILSGIGLLLAIVAGAYVGSADYRPLILGVLMVVGIAFIFWSGRFFWVIAVASSALAGTFPILGGSFNTFQILMGVGVAKFLIEDVVMRRTRFPAMPRIDLLLVAGFMGIITLHGLHDRFGMRFLGSTIWGGRNYVNVYVGFFAFFALQIIPIKGRLWDKLPYLVLAVTMFDLFIAVLTTVFPSTIFMIYPFYSAVSVSGVSELLTGNDELASRIGSLGNFGGALITIILARISLPQLFSLRNLSKLFWSAVGAVFVLASGFRTSVATLFLTVFVAGVRDLRLRVLALLPVAAALLFGLSFINSSVVPLPKSMQRALVFVPGNWDAEMRKDAAASNDFRVHVWSTFLKDYFPQHPWIGRGFGFRPEWTEDSLFIAKAVDYQQWVEVGNIHNGSLASLDALGIIGTIFFAIWNIRLLFQTLQVSFAVKSEGSFTLRFVALGLAVSVLAFWLGAVTVGTYLPQFFASAGVFLGLKRRLKEEQKAVRLADPRPPEPTEWTVAAVS